MRRILAAGLAALAMLAPAGFAQAGIYTDDLARCLVKSSTPDDKKALVVWIFSAMALHPDVSPLASISDARRKALNAGAGQLMSRLLTKDCRAEAVMAIKYEQAVAIQSSFGTLGQVAMVGLMSDPKVVAGMSGLGEAFSDDDFAVMLKEAGASSVK